MQTMTFYYIILDLLLVLLSTASPDDSFNRNIQQDLPRYQYKYAVKDEIGDGHRKTEARLGELARGQYYVKSDDASTDVKYNADKRGYHRFVKYTTSSSHSTASTHLALDNRSSVTLFNDSSLINSQKNAATQRNFPGELEPTPFSHSHVQFHPSISENQAVIRPELSTDGIGRNNELEDASTKIAENIYIETAGSFGQRVRPTAPSKNLNDNYRVTPNYYSSTENPESAHELSTVNFETSGDNYRSALTSLRKYLGLGSSNPPRDTQQINEIVINSRNSTDYGESTLQTFVTSKPTSFSKPIIVAELSNDGFQYSTTFPCTEENIESVTPSSTDKSLSTFAGNTRLVNNIGSTLFVTPLEDQARITTSSIVLNPIQAGVALVNAGNIDKNEFTSLDSSQPLNKIAQNTFEQRNPLHSEFESSSAATNSTGSPLNRDHQVVEIQRSLELYHSSPIQEIYYPPRLLAQYQLGDTIDQEDREFSDHNDAKSGQTLQRNQYRSEIVNDSSINANFQYQSSVNPSPRPLAELRTNAEGNDRAPQQKAYVNNVALENLKHPKENYRAQGSRDPSFSGTFKANEEQTSSLTEFTKLPYAFTTGQQNDKSMNAEQEVEKDTREEAQRFQSTLQRILSDSSDAAQHLEVGGLNYRDKQKIFDYPKSEINLTQPQTSVNGLYGDSTMQIETRTYPSKHYENRENKNELTYSSVKVERPSGHDRNLYRNGFGGSIFIQETKIAPQSVVYPIEQSIENVVEKMLPTGQSYPMRHTYPIPMGKIVENKVPYPIHKFTMEPYPIHLIEPYPMNKIQEKPAHIPLEIPVKLSYPSQELTKFPDNLVRLPSNVQFSLAYQPIINPNIQEYYPKHDTNSLNLQFALNSSTKDFQGHNKSPMPFMQPGFKRHYVESISLSQLQSGKQQQQSLNYQTVSKKKLNQLGFLGTVDQPTAYPWHVTHLGREKQGLKNQEYVGPLPPPAPHALNVHQQSQVPHPAHQDLLQQSLGASSTWRRMRTPEIHQYSRMGNFRQSKMEYGFKPPMVPSVQYDEQTATKVDS